MTAAALRHSASLFLIFYYAALAAELCLICLHKRYLRTVSFGFAAAGLLFHTIWLFGQVIPRDLCPVVNAGGWFFALAWGLVIFSIFLFFCCPKTSFGVLLLPAALAAVYAGFALAGKQIPAAAAGRTLGAVHGTSLLAATLLLLFGFVTGIMFFLQRAKMRRRSGFLRGISLPSLEWLQKANRRAVFLSIIFLGCGVFSGLLLRGAGESDGTPVRDLMVFGGIFLFILLAVLFPVLSRFDQSRTDVRIACLSILCFAVLCVILSYGILDSRAHWFLPHSREGGSDFPAAETYSESGEERPL